MAFFKFGAPPGRDVIVEVQGELVERTMAMAAELKRAHAAKELATHAPDQPYASAHRVHAVWGQWVPGYRPVTQPYTPAQRDRVRPAYTRYLQGQAGGCGTSAGGPGWGSTRAAP